MSAEITCGDCEQSWNPDDPTAGAGHEASCKSVARTNALEWGHHREEERVEALEKRVRLLEHVVALLLPRISISGSVRVGAQIYNTVRDGQPIRFMISFGGNGSVVVEAFADAEEEGT